MPKPAGPGGGSGRDSPLAPLLGIAPLAVPTGSLGIGLRLGLTVVLVHAAASLLLSTFRRRMAAGIELPAVLLVMSALLTAAQLVSKAYSFGFYVAAGALLPLILANGTFLAGTVATGFKPPARTALVLALRRGAGYALLLCAVGGLRQLFGSGLTAAPAGAFFVLAALAAARGVTAAR